MASLWIGPSWSALTASSLCSAGQGRVGLHRLIRANWARLPVALSEKNHGLSGFSGVLADLNPPPCNRAAPLTLARGGGRSAGLGGINFPRRSSGLLPPGRNSRRGGPVASMFRAASPAPSARSAFARPPRASRLWKLGKKDWSWPRSTYLSMIDLVTGAVSLTVGSARWINRKPVRVDTASQIRPKTAHESICKRVPRRKPVPVRSIPAEAEQDVPRWHRRSTRRRAIPRRHLRQYCRFRLAPVLPMHSRPTRSLR
jgi:hypothetical protein